LKNIQKRVPRRPFAKKKAFRYAETVDVYKLPLKPFGNPPDVALAAKPYARNSDLISSRSLAEMLYRCLHPIYGIVRLADEGLLRNSICSSTA
jgi:hypothetical protein